VSFGQARKGASQYSLPRCTGASHLVLSLRAQLEAPTGAAQAKANQVDEGHSFMNGVSNVNTPIAVFAYNRPLHLDKALIALGKCARLDRCKIFIYCDGQKDERSAQAIRDTRILAHEWAIRLAATVIERSINLGAGRSVSQGVTELCQQFGRVIVVEDDVVVSPDFVRYMLEALDKYGDDERVYQISGYQYPINNEQDCGCFFLPFPASWGWATWQRAWQHFDWDMAGASEALRRWRTRKRFDLGGSYPYSRALYAQLAGDIDAWDIQWYWTVFKAHGLALYPAISLTCNIGFDGSGTHYRRAETDNWLPQQDLEMWAGSPRYPFEHGFPDSVCVDESAHQRITRFLWGRALSRRTAWAPLPLRVLARRVRERLDVLRRVSTDLL